MISDPCVSGLSNYECYCLVGYNIMIICVWPWRPCVLSLGGFVCLASVAVCVRPLRLRSILEHSIDGRSGQHPSLEWLFFFFSQAFAGSSVYDFFIQVC